jgi:hypothetical protein
MNRVKVEGSPLFANAWPRRALCAGVILLSAATSATGQSSPKPPTDSATSPQGPIPAPAPASEAKFRGNLNITVENWIPSALRSHPDVLLAEAKLREAEAQLDKARMEATRNLLEQQGAVESLRLQVDSASAELDGINALFAKAAASKDEVAKRELKLRQLKFQLQQAAKVLDASIGRTSAGPKVVQTRVYPLGSASAEAVRALLAPVVAEDRQPAKIEIFAPNNALVITTSPATHDRVSQMLSAMREHGLIAGRLPITATGNANLNLTTSAAAATDPERKIVEALNRPTELDFQDMPLRDAASFLSDVTNITWLIDPDLKEQVHKVTFSSGRSLPTGALLQALEDLLHVKFAAREYGILVIGELPEGSIDAVELWRRSTRRPAAQPKETKGLELTPPDFPAPPMPPKKPSPKKDLPALEAPPPKKSPTQPPPPDSK